MDPELRAEFDKVHEILELLRSRTHDFANTMTAVQLGVQSVDLTMKAMNGTVKRHDDDLRTLMGYAPDIRIKDNEDDHNRLDNRITEAVVEIKSINKWRYAMPITALGAIGLALIELLRLVAKGGP